MGGWATYSSEPIIRHTLPKWSLFNDGAAVNQSCSSLHSATFLLRGRAIARPSCVYTVIIDVVDGGIVDNNGEFVNFSFLFT